MKCVKRTLSMLLVLTMLLMIVLTGCSSAAPTQSSAPSEESAAPATTSESSSGESEAPAESSEEKTLVVENTEMVYVSPADITFGTPDKNYKIGLAMVNVSTGFFKAMADALVAELEAIGVTPLLADCDNDAIRQVSQLENFIAQGVDGIIINPANPQSVVTAALQKVHEAGIPVIALDVAPEADAPYVTAYITDSYELGVLVGEESGKLMLEMTPEGDVEFGIIGGVDGNKVSEARYNGIRDGLKSVDSEGRIKEVSLLFAGSYAEEDGLKTAENMLVAHPNLKGIFSPADALVVGAYAAAQRQGRDAEIVMGGIDGSKPALEIMMNGGSVKALGVNSPVELSQAAARGMIAYLVDGTIPESRNMVLAPSVVTVANVNEFYNADSAF